MSVFLKIIACMCVCLIACVCGYAQNMVPNGDFEAYNSPGGVFPYTTTYGTFPLAVGWMNPKQTTPDYLNANASGGFNVPNTNGGYRTAHSGKGVVALDMVGWDPEHLECKLNQPMVAGREYYVSLFASKATNQWNASINCFGVHISDMMWLTPQPLTPSVIDTTVYPDVNWTQIQGIYTASGGEQWLTIGRMQPSFPVGIKPAGAQWGYMFVDDICVYDIGNTANYTTHDTSFCVGAYPYVLQNASVTGHYRWSTGDTSAAITINASGTYWRQTFLSTCSYVVDTFTVGPSTTTSAATICAPSYPYVLQNTAVTGNYTWSTGATTAAININADGIYWRKASQGSSDCGNVVDTFKVYATTVITASHTKGDCVDDMLLQPDTLGASYLWNDGATGKALSVKTTGTYWVSYSLGLCAQRIDTFHVWIGGHVTYVTNSKDIKNCADSILLGTDSSGVDYTWSNGATGYTYLAKASGTYWVGYYTTSVCEQHRDTFHVALGKYLSFTGDSELCVGQKAQFHNASSGFDNYVWFFGDGDSSTMQEPAHVYRQRGTYQIMLVGFPCRDTTYATIRIDSVYPVSFVTDRDSICTGQFVAFTPSYSDNVVQLVWDFGDGNTYANKQEQRYAFHNSGTYVITLTGTYPKCPDTTFKDTIHVLPYPAVNIGPDTSMCPNAAGITITDIVQQQPEASYKWSTGAATSSVIVNQPGVYYATVALNGCATTDSIVVRSNCYISIPNVFSPNGDGINDYFFPREILARGVRTFHMQLYNRWGAMLFETNKPDGRGWDGTINGVPQSEGVYVYLIEVSYINNVSERYQGNITVLR